MSRITLTVSRSIKLLLRDIFTTDRAGGSVHDTAMQPGVGTRSLVDTENKISISGGELIIAGGKTSPSWGDPRVVFVATDPITRLAGTSLVYKFSSSNLQTNGIYIGFSKELNPTLVAHTAGMSYRIRTALHAHDDPSAVFEVATLSNDTDYQLAVILRSAGAYYFVKGGIYDYWTLVFVVGSGTDTPLYPVIFNYDQILDISKLEVYSYHKSRYNNADEIATDRKATPAADDTIVAQEDALIEFTWTPQAAEVLELSIRYRDDDNRWVVRGDQSGSTIKLIKRELGVETEVRSAAQAWTTGTAYRVVLVVDHHLLRAIVNGVSKFVNPSYTFHYLTGKNTAKVNYTGDNFIAWPRRINALNAVQYQSIFNINRAGGSNAVAPLVIPTYDGADESVHPSVYDVGQGNTWNGYRYWMAMTPFEAADANLENPSIVVSDDGDTWIDPPGITNPLVSAPGGGHWHADPKLIMDNNTLWCFYLLAGNSPSDDTVRALYSDDGINWTGPIDIFTVPYAGWLSGSIEFINGEYMMFSVNQASGTPRTLEKRTATTLDGTWSSPSICTITPSAEYIWHLDTYNDGNRLFMMYTNRESSQYGLYAAYSDDNGDSWIRQTPQAPTHDLAIRNGTGNWDNQIYKAAFLPNDEGTGFDVWYSAYAPPSPYVWRIGRTNVYGIP